MSIAAVPRYLGTDFSTASPGLRFGLYLSIWTDRKDQESEIRQRARQGSSQGRKLQCLLEQHGMDQVIEALSSHREHERGSLPGLWKKNDHAARENWSAITALNEDDRSRLSALLERQQGLAALQPEAAMLSLEARATAPFATGLGNQHPLENGFAFLDPHGLPYLAGSGVKGVLRQAARELASGAWEDETDWHDQPRYLLMRGRGPQEDLRPFGGEDNPVYLTPLEVLFGTDPVGDREAVKPHVRGVLSFWDVLPEIHGEQLAVEIMTPHQGHYHAGGDTPHDSGQPNPILFLTVPPGSGMSFHVVCDRDRLERLAPELARDDRWKRLLEQAFVHAFQWLGFGAKTAVGYGAMARDQAREERQQQEREQQQRAAALAQMSPEEREIIEQREAIDSFREDFEGFKNTHYQPGGPFDASRNEFIEMCLHWKHSETRLSAADLLQETLKWGQPKKKDRRARYQRVLSELRGAQD